jgi:hypothetical protein
MSLIKFEDINDLSTLNDKNYLQTDDVIINTEFINIGYIKISKNFINYIILIHDKINNYEPFNILYSYLIFNKYDTKYSLFDNFIFKNLQTLQEYDDGLILINNGKQQIKIGKLLSKISKILNLEHDNNIVEQITNEYKSYYKSNNKNELKFIIYKGIEILKGYNYKNFNSINTSNSMLHRSCMNNKFQNLKLYIQNPNKISMLVLLDKDNLICGRALLWNLDKPKRMYLDRVYGINDYIINIFHNFARKHNWIYRNTESGGIYDIFYLNKYSNKYESIKSYNFKMKVKLNFKNIDLYPYLDSFPIKNKLTKSVQNYIPYFSVYSILHRVSGEIFNHYISILGISSHYNITVP